MAAPIVMSDEELYQQTGSWEAAAALRDEQNNALNQYNWSQPAAGGLNLANEAGAAVTVPTAVASAPSYESVYDVFGGKDATNDLITQFRSMGLDDSAIAAVFAPYQPATATTTNAGALTVAAKDKPVDTSATDVQGDIGFTSNNLATTTGALDQASTGLIASNAGASSAMSDADARALMEAQYATIGRTGVGTGANQIDQTGLDAWTNALVKGEISPADLNTRFSTAVTDYMAQNPADQYTTYVKDYQAKQAGTTGAKTETTGGGDIGATSNVGNVATTGATGALTQAATGSTTGVTDLYKSVLGRAPDAVGEKFWYEKFGSEISPEERAQFELAAKAELDSRTQNLYSEFMGSGRVAEQEGLDYWRQRFGNEIDASEKEEFRTAAAAELSGAFGAGGVNSLAGFKYAKDLGISDAGLKATLGEDLYNQYKNQLKTTATTSITDIVADNSLTFEESQNVANLARDLGFNSQQLADLTGKDKALFDTILTNYDTNRTKIINDTLTGANVLTDADRVVASYALEKQFGFTDSDIAKATGVDVKVIQDSLNPVRNFESDFSKIANNTDSTTQQIKDFVISSKANSAIDKLYGSALTGYENKIAELEAKWSGYGSDAIQSENLFQQLSAQRDALGGQFFQGVFGDLENSAALLVKKGLDTLGDLGQKDKFITAGAVEVITTADGQRVSKVDNEYFVPINDSEGSFTGNFEKIDPSSVTKKYLKYEDDGYGNSVAVPLSEQELKTLKDGTYQQKIGSVVIDKDTGAELTDTTGQLAFQKSGGHFTGKKHWLNAKFTEDGTPYLTATTEKSGINAFVSEMGPMVISIAAMIPGPHQPFAMMANAAIALEQKNYLGAVLSGLNAAGSFAGTELSTLKTAEAAGDIVNTSRILDLQNTVSNVKLAQTAISGVAALQADNIAGVINASLSAYGQTGGTLPSGVTTAFQAANLAIALDSNNVSAALTSLGDLTGSKDLHVAASATNLISALQSGNQANIIQAGLVFSNAFQAANQSTTTDTGTAGASNAASTATSTVSNKAINDSVTTELNNQLTFDASGSADINAASQAADAAGFNKFTFNGGTYTIDNNNAANTIANLEADALVTNTAANLAGGEMQGVDAQTAATAQANNVVIGNTEADNPDEAAYLARQRNPTGTTFTFGGVTYSLGTSNASVTNAISQAKAEELTNNIANAPTRSEAFRIAREGGLGASDVFTWQGKSYSAATAEERPDLSGTSKANTYTPTVTNFVIDKLNQNLSSAEFNPADLTKTEMEQFVNVYANATDAQKAILLKGADSMTFKVIDTLLKQTATLNPTGAGDQVVPAGSVDLKAGKAGAFITALEALQAQQKISSDAANAYLKANPNSSITNSVSTAYEAAGNLEKNVAGGLALVFNNKPLADALVKSGDDTTKMGQSIGTGVEDTKNWNETMELMSNATGLKKIGIMAGRIMDGTSGLSRQVQVELRQELPGLFLGGGTVRGILVATGAMDALETQGDAALGAYDAAIKKGATHASALASARTAGLVAGMTEAAVQLTLGKVADVVVGKIGNVTSRTTGKIVGEGVVEGTQEGGAALAVDLALGNTLNVNNYLTQAVAGAAVGKGTAVATSATDVAQTETINNTITTAVATGDAAGVNTAITNSVQTSLSGGASVEVAVGASVNSAITNGADVGASITSAVTTAVDSGADVSQTVTASVNSAITAGADSTVAINSTVTSAIASGADSTVVVTSAVTSGITAGADVTSTVTSAVQAAVTAGADVTIATTTATTAAVSASVNAGADVTTAITNGVSAAVTAGADVTTASNAAVTAAVATSVTTGADVSTSITTAVSAAVTAGADVSTAATTATTAAVTASITTGADTSTAITTAVTAAVDAGATVTTATNAAVTAAVTTSVATGTNLTTAIDTSVTAAVTAGANVNTAVTTAVTAAVDSSITTAVNNGTSVATAIDTSVASSITAAANANTSVTTAVDTAVSTAITSAVTNNADVTTAVDSAVTSAITTAVSSNVNVSTAVTTAVDSAVTTAINSNVNATAAITTSVTAAINTAVNANANVTTTVNAAVNSAVNAAVNAGVDTNIAVNAAVNATVNANIDTNININIDNLRTSATETAISATEKTDLISTVNDLISGTSTATPATKTTTKTPTKTPTKTSAGLTSGLLAGAAMAGDLDRLPPQMLKAYMTQDKFVDPLAKLQALQEGMNTEKMPSLPQVNTQEDDMPDQGNWKYGTAPDDLDTLFGEKSEEEEGSLGFKAGGYVAPLQMASGGAMPLPLLVKSGGALGALPRGDGRLDFRHGAHVAGDGDGQSDDIKAMLADGEFVFPADVVSALGNGSTKAGSDKLYEMMHSIRARARSKKPKDLPPPALKSPLDYLKKQVRSK